MEYLSTKISFIKFFLMKKKEHKFTTTAKKNRRMLKIREVSKIQKIKNWFSSTTIESDEEELAAEEISRTASQHI